MLKRFVGTRTLDVSDIPSYMNELDSMEDVYFGSKQAKDEKELAKIKGLYEYCWSLKPPKKPSVHMPYNLLTFLAKMAPKGSEEQFVTERLRGYGFLKEGQVFDEDLRRRVEHAFNWIQDFEEIKETSVSLTDAEKSAITDLIKVFQIEEDADKLQNAIYNTAKAHGLRLGDFFRKLYMILIGVPQGPKLGPYILAMGKQNVVKALQRSLEAT